MLTSLFWMLVTVASGLVQGSFTVPMKPAMRTWKWEHTWGMWSVWALLILPWFIGLVSIPNLFDVYAAVPLKTLLATFLVSLAWGIGAITFGMGVHYLGIALGFAIIMGLSTALGSLVPLYMRGKDAFQPVGLAILGGVLIMMLGIALGARAGRLKEKAMAQQRQPAGKEASFLKGLVICIVAGVCGSLMNIAFVVGAPIQEQAIAMGASPTYAPNAVWCISLLGGFIVNITYCLYLVIGNRNWAMLRAPGTTLNWVYTAAMGLMWMGSLAVYGICTAKLGTLGPAMGFALCVGMAIITGNLWGVVTGEWRGSGTKPFRLMVVSVIVLLAGMGMMAWSNLLTFS